MNINQMFFKHNSKWTMVVLLLMIILFVQSCIKKDDFNFDKLAQLPYDPNIAVPLVHSRMTIKDVLDDYDHEHVFTEDNTHFLYLIYERSVFSQKAEDLITISDQNVNTNFNFSIGTPPNGDSITTTQASTFILTTAVDESFDTMYIKAGTLNYNISGNLDHDGKIVITLPTATKNGIPFTQVIPYNYSGTLPVTINTSFNLTGYKVAFNHIGLQTILPMTYSVTVYGDGTPVNPPYSITMSESFTNIKYQKLIGYLGQKTFSITNDTIFVEIFRNNIHGYYDFEDPKLHINTFNAYGLPINVNIGLIEAHSDVNTPFIVPVTGSGIPVPWTINYPSFSQMGQIATTTLLLDKNNSTIKPAINIAPQYIVGAISAQSNPSGIPTTNFVLDTSRFTVNAQLELPLWGKAWDFILQDTIAFDYQSTTPMDVEWAEFKLILDNGFPIDGKCQLYFVDSDYAVLDSLLNPFQQALVSAIPGSPPDYRVVSNTKTTTKIRWDGPRWAHLATCKHILVRAYLNTANSGTTIVKIYSDYGLDTRLGVRVQGHTMVGFH